MVFFAHDTLSRKHQWRGGNFPSVSNSLGGHVKTSPGGDGQRATDAHPTNADGCQVGDGGASSRDQHIHRLGPDGRNDTRNIRKIADTGSEQAVGTG